MYIGLQISEFGGCRNIREVHFHFFRKGIGFVSVLIESDYSEVIGRAGYELVDGSASFGNWKDFILVNSIWIGRG